jgi:hypothetical protein
MATVPAVQGAAVSIYQTPAVVVLLGITILDEDLSATTATGLALIAAVGRCVRRFVRRLANGGGFVREIGAH